MRITRESLLKITRETVSQMVRERRSLVAVYLVGSLTGDEPLLGGATDIDLVFVHDQDPPEPREIIRLSNEITFDIAHHRQADYRQPRQLRVDPWIGPGVFRARLVYHDIQHWFEFMQASVGSQFNRPENVLERARQFLTPARDTWFALQIGQSPAGQAVAGQQANAAAVDAYLIALANSANAVASLNGAPLTERRLLVEYPERAQAAGSPNLSTGFLALIGADMVDLAQVHGWLPAWRDAYLALGQPDGTADAAPVRLHPARLPYYEHGILTMLDSPHPLAALWPLLSTWTSAVLALPPGSAHFLAWQEAMQTLGLVTAQADEKLHALDVYLDAVDETLEKWAAQYGIEPE